MSWTDANLDVQGYCLTREESRALRWGLRFPTALCLALVITGLALQSAALIFALVPIGAIAGWTRRHPFDLIWNHGLRHMSGGAEVAAQPKTPPPRLQAGHGLAVCGRPLLRLRPANRGTGLGSRPSRSLRTGHRYELLRALDAARSLVAPLRGRHTNDPAELEGRPRRRDGSFR
jgi:hypothetical protein